MKKWSVAALACALAAILTVTATGVGNASDHRTGALKGKTIVLVTYWLDVYGQAIAGWTKRYVEAAGGKLKVVDGKANPVTQINSLDNAIGQKVAGILWQPVNPNAAGVEMRKIQKAKIPLVIYGSQVDPKKTRASAPQVLIDDYKALYTSGQHAGQWITKNRPGEVPKVVAFRDEPLSSICKRRVDGFLAGIKSVRKDTKIVADVLVRSDQVLGRKRMENILTATPDFNVFDPCAADLGLGAYSALKARGRGQAENKVPKTEWIQMTDGTPPQLQLLFDKTSSVMEVITITPKENARKNLDVLLSVINGKLSPTRNKIYTVFGAILPPDCTKASKIFNAEYEVVKAFKRLTCK